MMFLTSFLSAKKQPVRILMNVKNKTLTREIRGQMSHMEIQSQEKREEGPEETHGAVIMHILEVLLE